MHLVGSQFLQFSYRRLAAVLALSRIPASIFLPYFNGAFLIAIGLPIIIKKELPQERGLDRIILFGRLFFAVPLVVFAAEHFTATKSIAQIIPSWIPGHVFWVYFVGIALIAAALSIVLKRQSRLSATLLGIMFSLFVVLIHIPRVLANPHDRIAWAVAFRDLSFSGGAFAFAGAQRQPYPAKGLPGLVQLGRFFIAIPALFFSVEHFLHPDFVPGVPLGKVVPAWIPLRLFWGYLTGVALLAAGVSLLINKGARLVVTYLGIVVFLGVLFLYLPMLAAIPLDIGSGLNYFADTLMFSGAILLLAGALPKEGHPQT